MQKPKKLKGKDKHKNHHKSKTSPKPKRLRVVNGRRWTSFDARFSEPTPEDIPVEVQRERCRIVAVLAYSSVVLLCLLEVYAFVMKDTQMMGRILTIVQILLICSIGSAAGPVIMHYIIGWFRHHG
jgi:hypothetical protein